MYLQIRNRYTDQQRRLEEYRLLVIAEPQSSACARSPPATSEKLLTDIQNLQLRSPAAGVRIKYASIFRILCICIRERCWFYRGMLNCGIWEIFQQCRFFLWNLQFFFSFCITVVHVQNKNNFQIFVTLQNCTSRFSSFMSQGISYQRVLCSHQVDICIMGDPQYK